MSFSVVYRSYQLFADAPEHGEDKYQWYLKSRYNNDEEQMSKYTHAMSEYGKGSDINFKFGGTIASTLQAHRVLQHFQEQKGAICADKMINCLCLNLIEQTKEPC